MLWGLRGGHVSFMAPPCPLQNARVSRGQMCNRPVPCLAHGRFVHLLRHWFGFDASSPVSIITILTSFCPHISCSLAVFLLFHLSRGVPHVICLSTRSSLSRRASLLHHLRIIVESVPTTASLPVFYFSSRADQPVYITTKTLPHPNFTIPLFKFVNPPQH